MASRVVVPETEMLQISGGDWLLVKKQLSAGESRAAFAKGIMYVDGVSVPNPMMSGGLPLAAAYLLDWNLKDPEGAVIVIREKDLDFVISALMSFDMDSYREILKAVDQHIDRMEAARDEAKKIRDGETTSSATSPSQPNSAGATNG